MNDTYEGLRSRVFDTDPASVRLAPTAELPRVWGALLEVGQAGGSFTLLSLCDGTTSIYFSGGGGVIGGGEHDQVVAATKSFLAAVEAHLDAFAPDAGRELPGQGRVVFRAFTYDRGPQRVEAAEDELGNGNHPLSPVFYAAHDVITQLRLIHEARSEGSE